MVKEKSLEHKVLSFPAYGGFAIDLLKHVAEQNNLNFMELWIQTFPNLTDTKAQQQSKKFKRDLDPRNMYVTKPKTSGYRLYVASRTVEIKAAEGKYKFKEHTSMLAKEWDVLTDAQKDVWNVKASKENEEYYKQLQEVEEKIRCGELAESPFRNREKPAQLNGFNVYCREERPKVVKSNPDIANNNVMKKLAEMWGKLSDDEKGKWKALSDTENKKNEVDFYAGAPISTPKSPSSKTPKTHEVASESPKSPSKKNKPLKKKK